MNKFFRFILVTVGAVVALLAVASLAIRTVKKKLGVADLRYQPAFSPMQKVSFK